MKILFISAVFPFPLHSGGQIRVYKLLQRLGKIHEISLYCCIRKKEEAKLVNKLNFCWKVKTFYRGRGWRVKYLLNGLFGPYPLLLASYVLPQMRQSIEEELAQEKYDLVHIEPFYVYPSLPQIKQPLVIVEHNLEHKVYRENAKHGQFKFLRPILENDADKIEYWEKQIWQLANKIIAVSAADAREIKEFARKKVEMVPNGVETSLFAYQLHRNIRELKFLFLGNFRWFPNLEALKNLTQSIWPAIKAEYPAARLKIIGQHLPRNIQWEAARQNWETAEEVENIVSEYYQASVLLAPMRIGGGSKYKIIEAMSTGLPIIATPQAVQGLELVADKHYLSATSPEEFIAKIKYLRSHKEKIATITGTARELVCRNFNWDQISEKLETVWEKACEK